MRPVVALRDALDDVLGRVSMYRLMTLVCVALVGVMAALTATGVFTDPFTLEAQALTLAVLVAASLGSNRLLALVWRVRPHDESALITALLLFLIFWPSTLAADLAWLAVAAVLANASKYVLAWRGRHVLNPAAAGAFLVVVAQDLAGREAPVNATWWIAAERLLPFVAVGALLLLWRTRRLDVAVVLVVVTTTLSVIGLTAVGQSVEDALRTTFYSFPVVFLAGFMLSEPLTLPPRRWQQLTVAAVTGLVLGYPLAVLRITQTPPDLGLLNVTPELALLVGNLVAFALGRRRGLPLDVVSRRRLAGDTWEVALAPRRPVPFRPGQYLELDVAHGRADRRGRRRAFSISSPPGARELTIATRVPERASSLKIALLALEPGSRLRATGVHGDFVWPRGGRPLLLVAGGIGLTPFLSQLRAGEARDVVLVLGVPDADAVPYRDELVASGVRTVLVSPEPPADLPAGWQHVPAAALTAEVVLAAVPDAADRVALVSGPPRMVNALRPTLRRTCAALRTDSFIGS